MDKSTEKELNEQISYLEKEIAKNLAQLKISRKELKLIESELEDFLNNYYEEVGSVFEEISKLEEKYQENTVILKEASNNVEQDSYDYNYSQENREGIKNDEVKRLYRKLVKNFHPDTSPSDPEAAIAFSLLSSSYSEHDLETMIYIEKSMEDDDSENQSLIDRLESLEKELQSILKERINIRAKKREIIESMEYQLLKKVRWSTVCGADLIANIKQNALEALEEKKSKIKKAG